MNKVIINFIKFYKTAISPFWGHNPFGIVSSGCRFYPTCSDYAIDAIDKYGVLKGSVKAVIRVLRCNPLYKPNKITTQAE